ncbi:hypothetical protein C8R47DRAFT_711419 [Mycena vitilis]|nr:hypothetical protein C8R47DRAFT_711419 [Mycena vitilis]
MVTQHTKPIRARYIQDSKTLLLLALRIPLLRKSFATTPPASASQDFCLRLSLPHVIGPRLALRLHQWHGPPTRFYPRVQSKYLENSGPVHIERKSSGTFVTVMGTPLALSALAFSSVRSIFHPSPLIHLLQESLARAIHTRRSWSSDSEAGSAIDHGRIICILLKIVLNHCIIHTQVPICHNTTSLRTPSSRAPSSYLTSSGVRCPLFPDSSVRSLRCPPLPRGNAASVGGRVRGGRPRTALAHRQRWVNALRAGRGYRVAGGEGGDTARMGCAVVPLHTKWRRVRGCPRAGCLPRL